MVSATGEAHRKEFTYVCKLGDHQHYGIGSSKKEAKQRAAQKMFQLIQEKLNAQDTGSETTSLSSFENTPCAIPFEEIPTVDEVLVEYRRLKKHYVSPSKMGLRYRKNYFMKLPKEKRMKAEQLLIRNHSGFVSTRDIVDEIMRTLELDYKIESRSGLKVFTLKDSAYDCVIMAKANDLFDRIIDYLKTMLNVQNADY